MEIDRHAYKLCIVGSGPSGCYLARSLLVNSEKQRIPIKIHMLDSLNKPYGLLRYGVSPDKSEIKKLMDNFDNTLFKKYSDRIKFIGNVTVGHDVTIRDLRKKYDLLVLAIGGIQSFNSLYIKNFDKEISNMRIGGVFSSRDLVLYYNNHPKFRHILNGSPTSKNDKALKFLTQTTQHKNESYNLKDKCNLYFENKNPLIYTVNDEFVKYNNGEINYGYTSREFRNYIMNFNERNAVIIGNGNVALDIARLLSFYSYFQLLHNEHINPDYLNLIRTSESSEKNNMDNPLFKNIYIIGRRGWIYNSFKYQLIKEFIDKSRKSKAKNLSEGRGIRAMMTEEDYYLSQNNNLDIETLDPIVKKRYKKMRSIFREMVENHKEYNNNLNVLDSNNFVNIYFKNLFSPSKIFTDEINIGENNVSQYIPFVKGVELERNNEHETGNFYESNKKLHIPCQILITSLGFKSDTRQVFKEDNNTSDLHTNTKLCPIFKTGWMETKSKGDISLQYHNSINLSNEIIDFLKKNMRKNNI